jgi:hypothetical protein
LVASIQAMALCRLENITNRQAACRWRFSPKIVKAPNWTVLWCECVWIGCAWSGHGSGARAGWPWNWLQLDEFWAPRLPASRKGTAWLAVLKTLVVYPRVRQFACKNTHFSPHSPSVYAGFSPNS